MLSRFGQVSSAFVQVVKAYYGSIELRTVTRFGLDRVCADTLRATTLSVKPPPFDTEAYFPTQTHLGTL